MKERKRAATPAQLAAARITGQRIRQQNENWRLRHGITDTPKRKKVGRPRIYVDQKVVDARRTATVLSGIRWLLKTGRRDLVDATLDGWDRRED